MKIYESRAAQALNLRESSPQNKMRVSNSLDRLINQRITHDKEKHELQLKLAEMSNAITSYSNK
jgi:hypothetical protein